MSIVETMISIQHWMMCCIVSCVTVFYNVFHNVCTVFTLPLLLNITSECGQSASDNWCMIDGVLQSDMQGTIQ